MYFGILADEEIKGEIRKYNLADDDVDFVASVAMGSLGKALEFAGDTELIETYKNIVGRTGEIEYKQPV